MSSEKSHNVVFVLLRRECGSATIPNCYSPAIAILQAADIVAVAYGQIRSCGGDVREKKTARTERGYRQFNRLTRRHGIDASRATRRRASDEVALVEATDCRLLFRV